MEEKEETDLQSLFNAMHAAKEAFDKYFEGADKDGAYFELHLDGWKLSDSSFERMEKITLDYSGTIRGEKIGCSQCGKPLNFAPFTDYCNDCLEKENRKESEKIAFG
jgi:hypothetical protein